jgi:hypothetical protein
MIHQAVANKSRKESKLALSRLIRTPEWSNLSSCSHPGRRSAAIEWRGAYGLSALLLFAGS